MAVRRRPARGAPGQHFLRSSRLAAELVRAAGIRPGNLVVDVGAGTGVLTSALADVGAHVVALEADSALAAGLRRRFDGRDVSVVEADATRWSWPKDAFSVVSNLPFAGSGAILRNLLRDPRSGLSHADVIVQWEFAQKHSAVWPTTLRGAYWQAWFEVAIVARLARSAFTPPSSVDAAVLRFGRRVRPLVAPERSPAYWEFLASAFQRQTRLGTALRHHLTPRELRRLAATLGFDASARPRDLDPGQWARVFEFTADRRARISES